MRGSRDRRARTCPTRHRPPGPARRARRRVRAAVTRILRRVVPFEGRCLLTVDPATLLPTGEMVEDGLPSVAMVRFNEIELKEPDFNKFVALAHAARGPRPASVARPRATSTGAFASVSSGGRTASQTSCAGARGRNGKLGRTHAAPRSEASAVHADRGPLRGIAGRTARGRVATGHGAGRCDRRRRRRRARGPRARQHDRDVEPRRRSLVG